MRPHSSQNSQVLVMTSDSPASVPFNKKNKPIQSPHPSHLLCQALPLWAIVQGRDGSGAASLCLLKRLKSVTPRPSYPALPLPSCSNNTLCPCAPLTSSAFWPWCFPGWPCVLWLPPLQNWEENFLASWRSFLCVCVLLDPVKTNPRHIWK